MHLWIKYDHAPEGSPTVQPTGADFHFSQMGGYLADEAYRSRESFFDRYVWHDERISAYYKYLRPRLKPTDKVLSIASGRCAPELALAEEIGFILTCSDLERPPCYAATKALFPALDFREIDVLRDSLPASNDAIICLSLIYLFDDAQLLYFFKAVANALKPDGRFLVHLVGSPDNALTWLLHDLFLPFENAAIARYLGFRHRKKFAIIKHHHGYHRSLMEIAVIAGKAGFRITETEDDCFDLDFRRGYMLNRIAKSRAGLAVLRAIGRWAPYVRMATMVRT